MQIAAGIVIYNPNKERLFSCISAIENQVKKIYIYNNGNSINMSELQSNKKVEILGNGENSGLGHALNSIFEKGNNDKIEWIITLDQDSVVPSNMVESFVHSYKQINDKRIGIICPRYIDKRREESQYEILKNNDIEYVDVCITSASMTSIKVWREIDKFDEKLFIDLIDNDFCKRLYLNDFKIMRLNKIILDQEKGEIKKKSPSKVKFYLSIANLFKRINPKLAKNISKLTYRKKVVPMRVYYTNRNIVYLNRKYRKYGGIGQFGYINYNCNSYLGFIICFNIPSLLRGQKKFAILKSIIKGRKDGKRINCTEYNKIGEENG